MDATILIYLTRDIITVGAIGALLCITLVLAFRCSVRAVGRVVAQGAFSRLHHA